jgi:hypothetical protein
MWEETEEGGESPAGHRRSGDWPLFRGYENLQRECQKRKRVAQVE